MAQARRTIGDNPLNGLVPNLEADAETEADGSDADAEQDASDADAEETPAAETKEPTATPMPAPRPRKRPTDVSAEEKQPESRPTKQAPAPKKPSAAAPAPAFEEPEAEDPEAAAKRFRSLEREKKQLVARVKDLELERVVGNGPEGESEEASNFVDESTDIISMIKHLEGQLDAALAVREALEADLSATQDKLSHETGARTEVEARVESLKAHAALADQWREDIAFVEQERDEGARRLTETTTQLAEATEQCGSLDKQLTEARARGDQLHGDNVEMEAQLLNLKDEVASLRGLPKELTEAAKTRRVLEEKVADLAGRLDASETSNDSLESELASTRQRLSETTKAREALEKSASDLTTRLEASETAKTALELDLAATREFGRSLRQDLEEARGQLSSANEELVDLGGRLATRTSTNKELSDAKAVLERDLKVLTARHESVTKELEAAKKALRDIRAAAAGIRGRSG